MDVEEALRTRRSIRKWQDREVPMEMIYKAITAASYAPSGGSYQPWKFVVIKDRDVIGRIADTVQAKVDVSLRWPGVEEIADMAQRFRRNAAFFRSAPVVIAVTTSTFASLSDRALQWRGEADPDVADMIQNRSGVVSRVQTIAGCTAYMLLALHNQGLGACWMTGPMLARKEIEQILEVQPPFELFSLVPVGFPGEAPEPAARRPLNEIVRVI